jgi:hypothetical protein
LIVSLPIATTAGVSRGTTMFGTPEPSPAAFLGLRPRRFGITSGAGGSGCVFFFS